MKKIIWFKIFLIFLYYRKILINNVYDKTKNFKCRNIIKNIYYKRKLIKNSIIISKFRLYLKKLPQWRKKVVNSKLSSSLKHLRIRLNLVSKITYYKYGTYFVFLKLYKLKKIYSRLVFKIKKMKNFKNKGVLKIRKLMRFIKNNKLKSKRVFNCLGLEYKSKKYAKKICFK